MAPLVDRLSIVVVALAMVFAGCIGATEWPGDDVGVVESTLTAAQADECLTEALTVLGDCLRLRCGKQPFAGHALDKCVASCQAQAASTHRQCLHALLPPATEPTLRVDTRKYREPEQRIRDWPGPEETHPDW